MLLAQKVSLLPGKDKNSLDGRAFCDIALTDLAREEEFAGHTLFGGGQRGVLDLDLLLHTLTIGGQDLKPLGKPKNG